MHFDSLQLVLSFAEFLLCFVQRNPAINSQGSPEHKEACAHWYMKICLESGDWTDGVPEMVVLKLCKGQFILQANAKVKQILTS